jgi:hypothetical protein
MTAFWEIALCNHVEVDRPFRDAYCLHHHGTLIMEAVNTSETSVYFNETTRCYILESCHLHISSRENMKFHSVVNFGFRLWKVLNIGSDCEDGNCSACRNIRRLSILNAAQHPNTKVLHWTPAAKTYCHEFSSVGKYQWMPPGHYKLHSS